MCQGVMCHASVDTVTPPPVDRVCPYALRVLHYLIGKLNSAATRWSALRVSYGMNGIILRSPDMAALAAYLRCPA